MGKCLSCCEQPDESNNQHANHSDKNGDGVRTELSSLGGAAAAAVVSTATEASGGGRHGRRRSSVESSAVIGANSSSHGDRHHPMNNEKRTFYPRIPPILSNAGGGAGEGKRGSSHGRDWSETKTVALYEQYKDPSEDAILSEGIEHLCRDLDVKPEDFRVLLLAWKFNAETMCRFTRHEFVSGCKCLKVSSIRGIQLRFADMLHEVQTDADKFKDLYRFSFRFGLDSEVGQRILPVDMAIGLWRLVFSQAEPPILDRWLAFLEKHPGGVRGIPRDTWNMFLNFLEAVDDDLSSYDDAEAWPSLFDDFVEYENDQTNQNVTPSRDAKMDDDDDDEVRVKDF